MKGKGQPQVSLCRGCSFVFFLRQGLLVTQKWPVNLRNTRLFPCQSDKCHFALRSSRLHGKHFTNRPRLSWSQNQPALIDGGISREDMVSILLLALGLLLLFYCRKPSLCHDAKQNQSSVPSPSPMPHRQTKDVRTGPIRRRSLSILAW